jgi:hypothetical protein
MAMQALPLAEARVIRTPAKTHETVDTKENGVLPYKISPKIAQNSTETPAMHISQFALTMACCFACISISAFLWHPHPPVRSRLVAFVVN